jgi:hypothetical protein
MTQMPVIDPPSVNVLPDDARPSQILDQPTHKGGARALRPARWILGRPTRWATAIVLLIGVARAGINTQVDVTFLEVAKSLPMPIHDYRGVILISPIIARILGLTTFRQWAGLHVVTEELFIVVTIVMVVRRFAQKEQQLFCAVALAASGLAVVSLNELGWYDVWVFSGAVLLIFGERWPTAIVGGLLFGCTNIEQAALALLALGLCAIGLRRQIAVRMLLAGAAAIGIRLVILCWYALYDVHSVSRAQLVGSYAAVSFHSFVRIWPIEVYSWYSASWVIVAALIWAVGGRRRLLLLVALVLIPAAGTLLTLDGTRVFVGIALPAFLLLIRNTAENSSWRPQRLQLLTALTLTVMLCTPGVMTWFGGTLMMPWSRFT